MRVPIKKMQHLLRSQMESIIRDTERAAIDILQKVQSIDTAVVNLRDGFTRFSTQYESAQAELEASFEAYERRKAVSTAARSQRRDAIEHELTQLRSDCRNLLDIASSTRVLALNARIEATRAGASGDGFVVVAREVGDLASGSLDAAQSINRTVDRIHRSLLEGERKACVEVRNEEDALDRTRLLFDQLQKTYAGLKSRVAEETGQADQPGRVGEMIRAMLSSIQFQDIVAQKARHVIVGIESLDSDSADVAAYAEGYTMQAQRDLHRRVVDRAAASSGEGAAIELF